MALLSVNSQAKLHSPVPVLSALTPGALLHGSASYVSNATAWTPSVFGKIYLLLTEECLALGQDISTR